MRSAAPPLEPPVAPRSPLVAPEAQRPRAEFRFHSLVLSEPESLVKSRGTTLSVSLFVHSMLVAAIIILPLFFEEVLPVPDNVLRAFFVAPVEMAPPPPPPPPPSASARVVTRAPAVPRPIETGKFTAPIEVPEEIRPEEGLDLGVEGGVPGGVEGGVPGGVVGGIVGGLPAEAPPPSKVVRIGGKIVAPKKVRNVEPEYPQLAAMARASGVVILEALVGLDGRVKEVKVLRGAPLFDEAAVVAVKQWRYQPLLLNGEPTEFILTVTLFFSLANAPK